MGERYQRAPLEDEVEELGEDRCKVVVEISR
jgi:hypothetical protein